MAKRTAMKPVKRQPKDARSSAKARPKKDGWGISKPFTEDPMAASLLGAPDEQLREEAAFWTWPDSTEGEAWFAISEVLEILLTDVGLDAKGRKLLWPDDVVLDFNKSIDRIKQRHPEFAEGKIAEFLTFWIEAIYEPKDYSDSQMKEFERLTERWVADLEKGKN